MLRLFLLVVLACNTIKLAICQKGTSYNYERDDDLNRPDYDPTVLDSMLTSITDSYTRNKGINLLALTDWMKTWSDLEYYANKGDETAITTLRYSLNVIINKEVRECHNSMKEYAPLWRADTKEYEVIKKNSSSRISPELMSKMERIREATNNIKLSCKVLDWTPFGDLTGDLDKFQVMCKVALRFLDEYDDDE